MVPLIIDILSTPQTPPLHTPILNIPLSLSKPYTYSNTKTWPGWLMTIYAVPTEISVYYWGSISNMALGLRGDGIQLATSSNAGSGKQRRRASGDSWCLGSRYNACLPSLIEVFAKLMLINLAFGSRFEPMTELRFKVIDYRSSSVTLRQGLASPVWLKICKA